MSDEGSRAKYITGVYNKFNIPPEVHLFRLVASSIGFIVLFTSLIVRDVFPIFEFPAVGSIIVYSSTGILAGILLIITVYETISTIGRYYSSDGSIWQTATNQNYSLPFVCVCG